MLWGLHVKIFSFAFSVFFRDSSFLKTTMRKAKQFEVRCQAQWHLGSFFLLSVYPLEQYLLTFLARIPLQHSFAYLQPLIKGGFRRELWPLQTASN